MNLKIKALLSGLSTFLPGYDRRGSTGGTDSARYCYSVWLRHLVLAARCANTARVPRVVAELGPGDSIGIGLAALLSGAERYFSLDLLRYSALERNLAIFDELVALFETRTAIPGEAEFPLLYPKLDRYDFPAQILGEATLRESLAAERIAAIRSSIARSEHDESMISYKAPWNAPEVINEGTVDFIYSQAVLEHIDALEEVYAAMRKWLRPDGIMSHQIDFKCHGKANAWNGHWTYGDFAWKVIVGRRPYLLNRQPHSVHVRLIGRNGFRILEDTLFHSVSNLHRKELAPRFRALSDDDLTTSGAFIVACVARGE
jgi:SAM-dependent methyltransferase